MAQIKVENRKLLRKWGQMDGQGRQERGKKGIFRGLIYRYYLIITCPGYWGFTADLALLTADCILGMEPSSRTKLRNTKWNNWKAVNLIGYLSMISNHLNISRRALFHIIDTRIIYFR